MDSPCPSTFPNYLDNTDRRNMADAMPRITSTHRLSVLANRPGVDLTMYRLRPQGVREAEWGYGLAGQEVAVIEGSTP
ncbi:MAG: hypothetical protein ACE5NP_02760 [Anaerolineae bacterium]